jgi:hypothetical protein
MTPAVFERRRRYQLEKLRLQLKRETYRPQPGGTISVQGQKSFCGETLHPMPNVENCGTPVFAAFHQEDDVANSANRARRSERLNNLAFQHGRLKPLFTRPTSPNH